MIYNYEKSYNCNIKIFMEDYKTYIPTANVLLFTGQI